MITEITQSHSTKNFNNQLPQVLRDGSNARPPKMEITGILTPSYGIGAGRSPKFKIVTPTREYHLTLETYHLKLAKKEWALN